MHRATESKANRTAPRICATPFCRKWIFVLLALLVPVAGFGAVAISITAGGDWTLTLDGTDLSGGAGTDFVTPQQSLVNQVTLKISGVSTQAWHVDVSKTDTAWHPSIRLWIKRSGNGTGTGTITGGTAYVELTDVAQTLFSGTRNRTGVTIRLRLNKASVKLGVDSFATTVTYTVSSP